LDVASTDGTNSASDLFGCVGFAQDAAVEGLGNNLSTAIASDTYWPLAEVDGYGKVDKIRAELLHDNGASITIVDVRYVG
jgi:hypothetical protein